MNWRMKSAKDWGRLGLRSNWKKMRVGDIIDEIAMGPFGSNIKVESFVSTGIPVLNGSNLIGFTLSEKSFNYVTHEKALSLKKAVATRGDVVITHRGTLGQIVYIPTTSKYENYVISQSQFRVRCNKNILLPEFMVYYFHSKEGQHQLLSNSSQVGVPALARPSSTFQELIIPIPSLEEQQIIIDILKSLNKKIINNTTLNHHLEQMAQAIFTKICNEGKNAVLSDILTVCYGKDHKRLNDGIVPCYGSGGIMRHVDKALYNNESVLIPRKGSLNNVLYINEPFWTVDTMFYTQMTHPNVAKFVYFTVRDLDLIGMNVGSAVPSMTTAVLNALEIVLPSDETLVNFEESVSPMFLQIQANNAESAHLIALRDTLLPKLMSGELSVADI